MAFPVTHYKARKMIGSKRDAFDKFVVCNKCDSIYKYEETYRLYNGKLFFI